MIVYRRFAVRRYEYDGSGIVDTVGSLIMLATAAKTALRGSLDAAKRAVPHLLAHKLITTIAKKRKRLEKAVAGSQKPQSTKASWYGIGLTENDWRIYITTPRMQCCR